jgi:sugar O-acyltransferase (sialic acid O-acetyltransferase NeuD family)
MRNLVIIGAGGFGREVLAWARVALPDCTIRGFLDDNPGAGLDPRLRAPVIGKIGSYEPEPDDVFVCAVGQPRLRRLLSEKIKERGGRFATLVHPTAVVAEGAVLADGVIVCPQVLISVDARVEEGAAVYYQSSVDHDARIGPWCQISAHCDITGGARLGAGVFFGSHATILPGVSVGSGAVIGAGAVVTRDVVAGAVVVGVPARARAE